MIYFHQALQTWKTVLLRPNLQTFEAENSKAKLLTALLWMAATGFIGTLLGSLIAFLIFPLFLSGSGMFFPWGFSEVGLFYGMSLIVTVANSILAVIFTPVSLLMISAILFLLAKSFKGKGNFETQTYLLSTFAAPLWLTSSVIGVIPIVGWLIAMGLGVYQVYLGYLVIQATHQLSKKQSGIVILTPVAATMVCFGTLVAAQFYLMAHFSGNPRVGFIFKPAPSYPTGCPPACSGVDLSGTNLFEARFNETNLSGANLRGVDARDALFGESDLRKVDFREADLSGVSFWKSDLRGANLSGVNLSQVSLYETVIDETTLIEPKWRLVWEILNQGVQGRDLRGIDLSEADLGGADLSGVDLSGSNLSDTNLGMINLSHTDLTGANLSAAWMQDTILSGANLSNANLSNARLNSAKLDNIQLNNTNLRGANLYRADLSGYNLSNYNLKDTYFSEANLQGVDFSDANLSWANLTGADLQDVKFDGADLSNADLFQAQVTSEQLNKAKSLAQTRMPDGTQHK